MDLACLPIMVVTGMFWLWSSSGNLHGRVRFARHAALTHGSFVFALIMEAVPWMAYRAPWLRIVLAVVAVLAFALQARLRARGSNGFFGKKRNRLAATLLMLPLATAALLWRDPADYFLLFAAAIYWRVRAENLRYMREGEADAAALREKILRLSAEVHNQELTGRAA